MEGLILILIVITALLAFDWLALRYGVDSRDAVGDDHLGHTRTAAF